jgi:hypothetical protein
MDKAAEREIAAECELSLRIIHGQEIADLRVLFLDLPFSVKRRPDLFFEVTGAGWMLIAMDQAYELCVSSVGAIGVHVKRNLITRLYRDFAGVSEYFYLSHGNARS